MHDDVGIVGAGVAGLVLATELAEAGISVTVYDGKAEVGQGAEKASGILSRSGLERLGIGYKEAIVNELRGAVLHSGRSSFRLTSKGVKAYVLDRARLARICARRAERSGASIELGRRLGADDIRALAKSSRVLVGADGAVSTVASTFGFPSIKEYVLTYKAVYEGAGVERSDSVGIYLDNSITPGFFGWTAPHSVSRVEVAVGIGARHRMSSFEAFSRFASTPPIQELVEGATRLRGDASLIPLSLRRKSSIGNVLLVGDAAGQVKATTGGGIIFGAACAKVAASVIKRHIRGSGGLGRYEMEFRRRYGLDLMVHSMAHRLYANAGTASTGLAFGVARMFRVDRLLSLYGDMDSPTRTLTGVMLRNATA